MFKPRKRSRKGRRDKNPDNNKNKKKKGKKKSTIKPKNPKKKYTEETITTLHTAKYTWRGSNHCQCRGPVTTDETLPGPQHPTYPHPLTTRCHRLPQPPYTFLRRQTGGRRLARTILASTESVFSRKRQRRWKDKVGVGMMGR